jgi:hypothetical protein
MMIRLMEVIRTYICPADHVSSGPVEPFKDGVLENLVWKVDSKTEFKQSKAKPDCAIFAPKMLERLHVQNLAALPVFSFPGHTLDVVLTVFQKATERAGSRGVCEPFAKSGRYQ